MILSHKLKLLFIAVPKTGTHAIRMALRKNMGEEDEEQVSLFVKKKFSHSAISSIKHGHIKAMEIKPVLDHDIWNSYFKFAIVRNPLDRYISFCSFMLRRNPDFKRNPKKFIHRIIDRPGIRQQILFKPQHEFICDEEGKIMLDYIGKFEDLQKAYDQVAMLKNLSTEPLQRINSSAHDHFETYYNEELKEKIKEYYAKDYKIFNY